MLTTKRDPLERNAHRNLRHDIIRNEIHPCKFCGRPTFIDTDHELMREEDCQEKQGFCVG